MVTENIDPLIGLRVGGVKNNMEERGALLRKFLENLRKVPNQSAVIDQISKYEGELKQIESVVSWFGQDIQLTPRSDD